jgi:cation:H+ antiporter
LVLAVVLLVAGTVVLYLGGEAAVRNASGLARSAGIPAFVIGALLFGIDIEGLGTALVAAGQGQPAVAAGSAFGTILFLFGAAFGLALLLSRDPIESPAPSMVIAPAIPLTLAAFLISDRFVSRAEGVLLLAIYVGYVAYLIREGRMAEQSAQEPARGATRLLLGRTLLGLVGLFVGASLLVWGGTRIIERTTLAAGFVGAAIIGTLASLDEVLLEVLPIRRGTPDLATGNLFGTLAAFTSGVLGLAALVRPLELDAGVTVAFLAAAFLYAVVAAVFLAKGEAGPLLGVFILGTYGVWLLLAAGV